MLEGYTKDVFTGNAVRETNVRNLFGVVFCAPISKKASGKENLAISLAECGELDYLQPMKSPWGHKAEHGLP